MILDYFKKIDDFYAGLQNLFNSLNVPVNYIDEKSLRPQDILSKTYKDSNPSYQLMDDVYILGMVDDAAFGEKESADISKIKKLEKDYDGILIFGVTLKKREKNLLPTRTQLAEITRAFNREFYYTPVVVVFRYDNFISLANAERLEYKQEWREGEKTGKVSILRDVEIDNPHTGHLKILDELKITRLGKKGINSFNALYQYWQEVFSVSLLNKKFFSELSNWYFWAIKQVTFPSESIYKDDKNQEYKAINVIRLLTRLLFVWFIKEKKLIPEELFDLDVLQKNILKKIEPIHFLGQEQENLESIYYKAILQNLFFATLNCPIKPDSIDNRERGFRGDESYGKHRGVDYLMRYKRYFKDPDAFLKMVNEVVPFLNGGLFECLDDKENNIYIDGFSDNMTKGHRLIVPDYLFFGKEENTDLSSDYGVQNKGTKEAAVKGLINILKSYKFTISENTPIEEDVALDPELLGKVFENLLASYNPETKTTARKQTGSFYTPREIVNYMVDESLIAHLKNSVSSWNLGEKELDDQLHKLVSFDPINPFENKSELSKEIIHSLDSCKILDPACGSGAFPMGILQKMVHILQKVDPDNKHWQDLQQEKAIKETEGAFVIRDKKEREQILLEINEAFDETINNPNYARKLFLIENCIYGVDIQPIATQISKLRFFISLVVEQKVNMEKDNFGIIPLPNLETKFITANTLIGIEKPEQKLSLFDTKEVKKLEQELKTIRHKLFGAKTKATKVKYRKRDEELRNQIAEELKKSGWDNKSAEQLASWDPYDQNGVSPFFDPEWMFDIKDGFDVVIGNPPYGILNKRQNKAESIVVTEKELTYFKNSSYYYPARGGMLNIFRLFILKSINLLSLNGVFSEIFPLAFTGDSSIKNLRKYILDNNSIISIEAFPERDNPSKRVFEAVKMSVCILTLTKQKSDRPFFIRINTNRYINTDAEINIVNRDIIQTLDKNYFSFPLTSIKEINILSHVFKQANRFYEIGKCNTGEIDMTFCKNTFTNDQTNPPLLKGAIIDRYLIRDKMSQGEIVFIKEEELLKIKKIPIYLKKNERIVLQGITGVNEKIRLKMMIIKDAYCANSLNYLTFKQTIDTKYALGIFNSSLLNFIFKKFSTNSNVNGYEVDNLPFIQNRCFFQTISKLVAFILFSNDSNHFVISKVIDNCIDALVFQIYFPDHMKERDIDILKFIEKDLEIMMRDREFDQLTDTQKLKLINELHARWTDPENEIVKRMNSFAEKSPEILKPILEN